MSDCVLTIWGDCSYAETGCSDCEIKTKITKALELFGNPEQSAQPDLSDYSDKLWKAAYERGKRDAQSERKTGEWEEIAVIADAYDISGAKTWASRIKCDQCGFTTTVIEGHFSQYNFCPNCGADMRHREESNDNTNA